MYWHSRISRKVSDDNITDPFLHKLLEKYPIALELLKKAHILSEVHPPALAATLNNMACYYRRLGKNIHKNQFSQTINII